MRSLRNYIYSYGRMFFFIFLVLLLLSFFIWLIFISDIFKNFLLWLEIFIQTKKDYVYLVAFLVAVAEGTIILGMIPGTTYIITLGVFWARGDVDPILLFPIVIVGAVLGDLLGYALGSFYSGFVRRKFNNKIEYKIAKKFIVKHGAKSVFIARFISGMKELVPFVAGILNMKLKRFMFFNFLGAIGWSILWIMVGFTSGSFITEVSSIVKTVGFTFLTFFIISAFIFYKKNKDRLILHGEHQH